MLRMGPIILLTKYWGRKDVYGRVRSSSSSKDIKVSQITLRSKIYLKIHN